MRLCRNDEKYELTFANIPIGEIFLAHIFNKTSVFMHIEQCSFVDELGSRLLVNAVDLMDGTVHYFNGDIKVGEIQAELCWGPK